MNWCSYVSAIVNERQISCPLTLCYCPNDAAKHSTQTRVRDSRSLPTFNPEIHVISLPFLFICFNN